MASNVVDLFGAYVTDARKASETLRRSVDFGEVILPTPQAGRAPATDDKGVSRPNEPASAQGIFDILNNATKGGANPGGAFDQSGRNSGLPAQQTDATGFFSRVLWGGAGFVLFLVGAIMSRPREVQALAAATDTAGNILTAPAKAAKGVADTAGIFAIAAKGGGKKETKPQEPKEPLSLDAPKPPSPPPAVDDGRPVRTYADPKDTIRELASKAGKASGEARKRRRMVEKEGYNLGSWVINDINKPGPLSAVENAIRQGVPPDRVIPGKPNEPRPKVEPPPKDEFKPDPALKKIADEIRESLNPKPKKDDKK